MNEEITNQSTKSPEYLKLVEIKDKIHIIMQHMLFPFGENLNHMDKLLKEIYNDLKKYK